jgi:xanthine dehydrogenase small subunit
MATIGGNFINASPIGDFSIFFLALDATLVLSDGEHNRELPLRQLYKGYKQLAKTPEEYITQLWFEWPETAQHLFSFEKVSKRTHLDIASVNTALHIRMENEVMAEVHLAAGGVGPVPMRLERTAAFLQGRWMSAALLQEALAIAQTEVTPISDARGTEAYKRLLLNQLIKAHFITLFPQLSVADLLNF